MDFPNLAEAPVIAFDTETTGLHWWSSDVFGLSVAAEGGSWYWDLRSTPEAVRWLRDTLPAVSLVVGHNMKFDIHHAACLGVDWQAVRWQCTMTRAALIDEHLLSYDLDSLGKKYIGVGKTANIYKDLAELFGGAATKGVQIKNLPRAPFEMAAKYAKQDATTCLRLWQWQEGEIRRQGLERVHTLETELLPILVGMEREGVRVDIDRAERAVDELEVIISREQVVLNQIAGFVVNPNPSGSIHRLFEPRPREDGCFTLIDGTIAKPTGAGKASIGADCLRQMKHPAAAKILKLRKLKKARDTFLTGHVLGHLDGDRVHYNVNQTRGDNEAGTGTGRISINDPAMQQIPARDVETASIVRSCFIPRQGQRWLCADWAQFEFRWFAHYVNDSGINRMFAEDPDSDFHKIVSTMTGLPRSPRFAGDPNAKQINLGMVFGMGEGKLAQEMGLPYGTERSRGREYLKAGDEAKAVFEKYHGAIPGVRKLLESASSVARSRGYVTTALGRHIRFPKGQFVHKAGGLIFQGTSADCMKQKMIEMDRFLREWNRVHGRDDRMVLTVHDELDFSVDDELVRPEIEREFTRFDGEITPIKCRIPITCEIGVADNWFDASK